MRKLITFIMLLSVGLLHSQYKRASFEGSFGGQTIADQCAVLDDNFNHYSAVIRYSINPTFGVGIYTGYDNLSFTAGDDAIYERVTLEGVANLSRILKLHNETFILLGHGGLGLSRFETRRALSSYYRENMFALSGGFTGLFKVSPSLAVKADWTTTGNAGQDRTLDNRHVTTNRGINSFVNNFSVGLALYLGREPEHADWYEEPVDNLTTIYIDRTRTIDKTKTLILPVPIPPSKEKPCDCRVNEYVYFDYDSYEIGIQGRNAIQKIVDQITEEDTLTVVGYACPSGSDSYNIRLSKRRAKAVYTKLVDLGVDKNQIELRYEGKDLTKGDFTHEFARRVEMLIGN